MENFTEQVGVIPPDIRKQMVDSADAYILKAYGYVSREDAPEGARLQ